MTSDTVYVGGCLVNTPEKETKSDWLSKYNQSNVLLSCSSIGTFFPTRWSPLSIKCAFNGKMIYETDNTVYALHDENILLLNQDTEFTATFPDKADFESFTINFSPQFLAEALASFINDEDRQLKNPFEVSSFSFMEKTYFYNDMLIPYIAKIRSLISSPLTDVMDYELVLLNLLKSLLLIHGQLNEDIDKLPYQKRSTREELFKRLQSAKEYANACFEQSCTVEKLARVSMLNTYYFAREFKKHFSVSPHQYIIDRRIEEAKKLLNKDYSVTEACRMVGFEDIASFSKLFKRKTGINPSKY